MCWKRYAGSLRKQRVMSLLSSRGTSDPKGSGSLWMIVPSVGAFDSF